MREDKSIQDAKTASGINIAAGVWLILSPYILGFANNYMAMVNAVVMGIVIGVLALIRVISPLKTAWMSWANLILGIWLGISSFFYGFTSPAIIWNSVILGVLVIVMAAVSSGAVQQHRHA